MADEPKTDGSASASATPAPGAKPATSTANDKAEHVPMDRFEGVVAERNRWKEKAEGFEAAHKESLEKHKTESQKQIDAALQKIIDVEWKPKAERLDALEGVIKADVEEYLARIPEPHRAAVDQSAPVEVQLRQAKALAYAFEASMGKAPAPRINGGASPQPVQEPTQYTRAQWDDFMQLGRTDRNAFDQIKGEMYAAAREGRVAGISSAVGPKA